MRGFIPFMPVSPVILYDIPWQNWILSDGVFDPISGTLKRAPGNPGHGTQIQDWPLVIARGTINLTLIFLYLTLRSLLLFTKWIFLKIDFNVFILFTSIFQNDQLLNLKLPLKI